MYLNTPSSFERIFLKCLKKTQATDTVTFLHSCSFSLRDLDSSVKNIAEKPDSCTDVTLEIEIMI